MPSLRSVLAVCLLWACNESPVEDCNALTWQDFGQGYLRSWCTGCHHRALSAEDRNGAPLGVDFDEHDAVVRLMVEIEARATGATPTMPPIGGSSDDERARFAQWLACGAP